MIFEILLATTETINVEEVKEKLTEIDNEETEYVMKILEPLIDSINKKDYTQVKDKQGEPIDLEKSKPITKETFFRDLHELSQSIKTNVNKDLKELIDALIKMNDEHGLSSDNFGSIINSLIKVKQGKTMLDYDKISKEAIKISKDKGKLVSNWEVLDVWYDKPDWQ